VRRHEQVAERRQRTHIICHRGSSEHAPEKTLEAYRAWAAIRNLVVHLLQGVKAASKAAATQRFGAHSGEALPRLLI
jgi:hypothetical protein